MAGAKRWRTFACATITIGLTWAAPAGASPFSDDGIWDRPIPAGTPSEPSSTARIADLVIQIRLQQAAGNYPSFATSSSSTPVYYVTSSTPKRRLILSNAGEKNVHLQELIDEHGGVPFPAGAQPDHSKDGHITVLDTESRTVYEFYRASSPEQNRLGCLTLPWHTIWRPAFCHRDGQWHAVTGGIMQDYGSNIGVFSSLAWPGLADDEGWNWGATATSLPLIGGLVTFEDLESGVIDHAVSALVGEACENDHMYPAQRDDGTRTKPSCMPEGARLQLDPAYDVEANSHPPLTKMIERAAQRYGIVITDITHKTFSFKGQDPQTERFNPYTQGPGVGGVPNGNDGYFDGQRASRLFRDFPWERLRVVDAPHCITPPAGPCYP